MTRIGIDVRKIADFGIGTYLQNLLRGLAGAGEAYRFVLFHKPGAAASDYPGGMELRAEPSRPYSLLEPVSLGRTVRRARLGLLHCPHYVTPFTAGCPLVVTIHDLIHILFPEYLPGRRALTYARFFLRRAARKAKVIFAVSECTRRDILEHLPVREDKVVVTYEAVDPRMRIPVAPEERGAVRERFQLAEPFVLFVGNIKKHKNLSTAVGAFAGFRRKMGKEWRLVVCGGSRPGNETYRRIETEGVREAVRFFGFVKTDDLRALYAEAALFIFPSLYEGFGLPPLEAMAAGTPVVASDCSSIPEVLGDAALLVDPRAAAAFAEAMERIVGDDELRRRLVARGRERVAGFTWERTVRSTLAGYSRALESA